jgi:hypothetical protein
MECCLGVEVDEDIKTIRVHYVGVMRILYTATNNSYPRADVLLACRLLLYRFGDPRISRQDTGNANV